MATGRMFWNALVARDAQQLLLESKHQGPPHCSSLSRLSRRQKARIHHVQIKAGWLDQCIPRLQHVCEFPRQECKRLHLWPLPSEVLVASPAIPTEPQSLHPASLCKTGQSHPTSRPALRRGTSAHTHDQSAVQTALADAMSHIEFLGRSRGRLERLPSSGYWHRVRTVRCDVVELVLSLVEPQKLLAFLSIRRRMSTIDLGVPLASRKRCRRRPSCQACM